MAEIVALVGGPGKGKSTSIFPNEQLGIQGLDLQSTVIINVSGKSLSMRGWKKYFTNNKGGISKGDNYVVTHDATQIAAILKGIDTSMPQIKNVVIEDAQYLMGFAVMEKNKEKGFDKWNQIADTGFKPLNTAKDLVREDLFVWFVYHDEADENGERKIKTAGKLIDNVITLEGLFNTILYADVEINEAAKKSNYYYITNVDGKVRARSKYGTFKTMRIPNDLGYVRSAIEVYNSGE